MRTHEARRMRKKALRYAKQGGHDVALISKTGAMELYGCLNCTETMDLWDSPAIVNGPMQHRRCPAAQQPSLIKNIFSYFSKFFYRAE